VSLSCYVTHLNDTAVESKWYILIFTILLNTFICKEDVFFHSGQVFLGARKILKKLFSFRLTEQHQIWSNDR